MALDELLEQFVHQLGPRIGRQLVSGMLGACGPSRGERAPEVGIGGGPDIDPGAMGYEVLAFAMIEIAQGRLNDVVDHLRQIPEVLDAYATTGPSDLHCRLVAKSNDHLHQVVTRILEVQGITRTTTVIALSQQIGYRVIPLVEAEP